MAIDNVSAMSSPDFNAVNLHRTFDGGKIQVTPVMAGFPEHDARSEEIVGQPGAPVRDAIDEIDVPVVDDFDSGVNRFYRRQIRLRKSVEPR